MKLKTVLFSVFITITLLSGCKSKTEDKLNVITETKEIMNNKINANPEDEAGIRKALDAYIEAALKGDSKIAKPVFGELATISYSENDSMVSAPIQALFDYYDQTGPHHAEYEISSLEVAGNVAIVRIDSKFGDVSFYDMFALVKDVNDWKIVIKVYNVK